MIRMTLALPAMALLLLSCGGSGGSTMDPDPLPIAERFPIDGVVDFTGLSPRQAALTFQPSGVATTLTWAFANDDRHLYVALVWSDPTFNGEWTIGSPVDIDAAWIYLDDDGNGNHETNEDKRPVMAAPVGSFFADLHVDAANEEEDLVGDGLARLEYDATAGGYRAEFLIPLNEDSEGEDAEITTSTRYNIVLQDHVQPGLGTSNQATLFGTGAWETVPLSSGGPWTHPAIPAGLTGLIVFVSAHEDPNGDIYTFDPATGTIFRVTTTTLVENNVSLSHDRTRIAFNAHDPNDLYSMEIYTINVDGTGLAQLTNDGFINAHPAWSPDDSLICWSPLTPGLNETISIMPSTGGPGTNITPPGVRDSDAEFLQDGRLVFKTDRWNAYPQLQTGVMNGDGTNAQQLTFTTGVSEHDPVGDATHVLFTRYMKGTEFSSDPEAIFTPWNLVEARLDGTGETTILGDDWINAIPVYDPTGQYVLYIRMTTFQETVLMTRTGAPLGRLIPGITRIEYIDWK